MKIVGNLVRIDHRNKFIHFDNKTITDLKEQIYSIYDYCNNNNCEIIKKYFEKVFSEGCKLSHINSSIILTRKIIIKNKSNLISNNKAHEILENLSFKIIRNNLIHLNEKIIYDIALILLKYFTEIKRIFTGNEIFIEFYKKNSEIEVFYDTINLPDYMIKLKDILEFIKIIELSVPSSKDINKLMYILVLSNINWLFPNTLEVKIDFNCLNIINTHDLSFKLNKENRILLEIILMFSYFISQLKSNHSLSIKITDTYQAEIDYLLKSEKLLSSNFHLLDLVTHTLRAAKVEIYFNSLDSNTFKRILYIIHMNNSLRSISLNLFPEDELYNLSNIIKFTNIYDFNFDKKRRYSNIIDENEHLLDNLVLLFENNLEALIYTLMYRLSYLNELRICIDMPTFIFQNDKFKSCILKFIINIFKLLECRDNKLQTFELKSENFCFNSKIYPNIDQLLYNLNKKNETVRNYTLNLGFRHVMSISKIIPNNIQYLSLSNLDIDTLISFTDYFKNNIELINFIKISLDIDINNIFYLYEFLSIKKKIHERSTHYY